MVRAKSIGLIAISRVLSSKAETNALVDASRVSVNGESVGLPDFAVVYAQES